MSLSASNVTLLVTDALDALEIPYYLGGSLACAVYGMSRATQDVDLVADLRMGQATPLAAALQDAFYVDKHAISSAIIHRSSFNAIHKESMFKVDVFVPSKRAFSQVQFSRRVQQVIISAPARSIWVASPEDVILAKLEWYRMGNEVSENQWRDVQWMLRLQDKKLDTVYLREWARQLGILSLLERAMEKAGLTAQ